MNPDGVAARSSIEETFGATTVERLDLLASLLAEENEHQNLVASRTLPAIWQRHFADSAQILRYVPRETLSAIDLGSGAGFPGLVLALLRPAMSISLIESRRKRAQWLQNCVNVLNLGNCTVEHIRLENYEARPVGLITARAFAPLEKLLFLSARFSTDDTVWVLPKGRSAAQELASIPKRWQKLFHVEQSITDPDASIIVGRGRPAGKGAA